MKRILFDPNNFIMRYVLAFISALLLSLFLTPVVRRISLKYKFVSFPKQDRWRKRVVASLGGAAIFAASLLSYLIFTTHNLISLGFIVGSIGIFWLGLVDDIVHIKPDTKLIGQIVIACITVMFGVSFKSTSLPLINILLTIFWIVGIINAFNLLDNMDGLCAGIASVSSLMLCIHSVIYSNWQLTVLSLIILGSSLGFLKYNFSPAKIFMGDCGSMFLGYALAMGALMGATKEQSGLLVTMAIPVFVLAVPIFDTMFVIIARTINNRPISQGGKDHTSHRLVALGLSERNAVLLLYIFSTFCGLGGILYDKSNILHTILLIIFVIGIVIFGIFLSSEARVYSSRELDNSKIRKKLDGKAIFNGFIYNKRRIVEVILDFIIVSVSYVVAFVLRFEGVAFDLNLALLIDSLPIILIIKFLMFYTFGLYRGVWRYIGLYDIIAIFKATSAGSLLSVVVLFFFFRFKNYSRTVFVIDWLVTFCSISGVRILFRVYQEFFANFRITGKRILIFGAGDTGEMALREIRQNRSLAYKPIGFIDDDEDRLDRLIHGVKVLGVGDDLEKLVYKHKIDELLIAIPISSKRRRSEIYEVCKRLNISPKDVSKIIPYEKESL